MKTTPRRVRTTGNKTVIVMGKGVSHTQREIRFAHQLISVARYHASEARKSSSNNYWRLRSNTISAICAAYASIDAAYNEFIHIDALSEASGLSDDKREVLHYISSEGLVAENSAKHPLARFNLLLRILERPELEAGAEPFQSANILRALRNILVHAVPSTVVTFDANNEDLWTQQDIVKSLRPRLSLSSRATFPDDVLTATCAVWASRTCERFLDGFQRASGVTFPFILQVN